MPTDKEIKDIELLEYKKKKAEDEKALNVIKPSDNKRAVMALRKHLNHPVLAEFMNHEGITDFGVTSCYYDFLEKKKVTVDVLGYDENSNWGKIDEIEIVGRNLEKFIDYILLTFDQRYVNMRGYKEDFRNKVMSDYQLLLQMEVD